ncbi:MAG: two pore domain potassium channel family protein [Muribaculaceae bacterium]|nr:two pore domain potassium channel family protein [Muribaculaceae bacterium]MCI9053843.1 two pore domain potassium channel family protein [Muribaculaceae bacterium]
MSTASATPAPQPVKKDFRDGKPVHVVEWIMHMVVLLLSIMLIVYISYDTFRSENFLANHRYMTFQFWVCVIFVADFFIELIFAEEKWKYVRHRLLFLLISIPYLNIVTMLDLHLSPETLYFVRFIPLARGALALSIVFGYFSSNAITSFFMSYIVIMVMIVYFCSLIFYNCEEGVNPQVDTYWTALWWAAMNMSTVGCYINPMTIEGRIVAVILPISGMIIFPLFTVYLTDYVKRHSKGNIKN